jgi:hypothetical protein
MSDYFVIALAKVVVTSVETIYINLYLTQSITCEYLFFINYIKILQTIAHLKSTYYSRI